MVQLNQGKGMNTYKNKRKEEKKMIKNVWVVKKVVNGKNVVVATCDNEQDAYNVVEKMQTEFTTFKVVNEFDWM